MNKNEIVIRRPKLEELAAIHAFFEMMLKDTFEANGVSNLTELLEEEIQVKKKYILQDVTTDGKDRFFLLAVYDGEIIGSIEYGASNEVLNSCTNNKMKDILEIGTVFVHPKYQKQGISSILLNKIFQELDRKLIQEVCFDSGYKIAQSVWRKKFGSPAYCFNDYWAVGFPHMIWRVKVKEALEILKYDL
ncbi:MAG: N-acetyltransferase [Herbinix sp.]|jgi:GNAT superfamily N-acetyltransferase|nr:N-acetyltransferase [Herbinix sp.]